YDGFSNAAICNTMNNTNLANQAGAITVSNCSNNFNWLFVGSRTQWNPVPNFGLGVDVLYMDLLTANAGTGTLGTNGGQSLPGGTYTISNQAEWSVRFRAHRDFNP